LGGCVWLPRILAKARLLRQGALPSEYESRFCHATGVDGQFLAHFGLTREDVLAAAALPDAEAAAWLAGRTTAERIREWNHLAVNLGRPGFPMAERFPAALSTTYQHLAGRGLTSVFEVLEADEQGA
jgi:hypothetical protein